MTRLRICWLNTWCLPYVTTAAHIQKLVDFVSVIVQTKNPQVMALCELFDDSRDDFISKFNSRLPNRFKMITTTYGSTWWGRQSCGILVMYDQKELSTTDLAVCRAYFDPFVESRSVDRLATKGVVTLVLRNLISGRCMRMSFTHLQDAHAPSIVNNYTSVTKTQLAQILTKCKKDSFLIVGDFNIEPNSSYAVVGDMAANVIYPSVRTHRDGLLDYAICSRDIDAKVSVVETNTNPSDHEPILIDCIVR